MALTIERPSDIEADLVAQSRAHGLDLPQFVSTCSANTCVCGHDLLFRRLSRLPRGANQPTDYLIHRLFPMTQSAAKAFMAIAEDDHPAPGGWDARLMKKHGFWVFHTGQLLPASVTGEMQQHVREEAA